MTVARDDFAIFILSHGRADILEANTHRSMLKAGYTGPWYIVLDSDDETRPEYEAKFGADHVLVFEKDDQAQDLGENFDGPKGVIIYARNAAARFAKELGYRYYMQLDDDYSLFLHRFVDVELSPQARALYTGPSMGGQGPLRHSQTRNLDRVLDAMVEFLEDSGALTVAFGQGGDFIGGADGGSWRTRVTRKAMNTFIARTDRPINFVGRINEDVNTYTTAGGRGELLFTILDFSVNQLQTQKNAGGMSEAYLDFGTYLKSFYTVMMAPSCVKVGMMGWKAQRMHHSIAWGNAVPKIISGAHRKPR